MSVSLSQSQAWRRRSMPTDPERSTSSFSEHRELAAVAPRRRGEHNYDAASRRGRIRAQRHVTPRTRGEQRREDLNECRTAGRERSAPDRPRGSFGWRCCRPSAAPPSRCQNRHRQSAGNPLHFRAENSCAADGRNWQCWRRGDERTRETERTRTSSSRRASAGSDSNTLHAAASVAAGEAHCFTTATASLWSSADSTWIGGAVRFWHSAATRESRYSRKRELGKQIDCRMNG